MFSQLVRIMAFVRKAGFLVFLTTTGINPKNHPENSQGSVLISHNCLKLVYYSKAVTSN
jgi:hypothetical protein